MVPIEETFAFFSCYRLLINTFRLAPEAEALQLTEILRRVREMRPEEPSESGRRCAEPIRAGGSNL